MLIDTHAHYYDARFDEDREELLGKMQSEGICNIINSGCTVKNTKQCIEMAEKYPFAYATAGLHPQYANSVTHEDLEEIRNLALHEKVVAVGEIGLDYHYGQDKERQKEIFALQMGLANEIKKPIVIHCREACGDCLDVLKANYKDGGGVMHCFSESVETARIIFNMGLFISVGGTLTFKNNVRTVEAVRYAPLDRIMLETDCPYLAPVPHRGERNSSLYMHHVAEKIAEIKGISVEEVAEATTQNAKEFYRIGNVKNAQNAKGGMI